MSDSTAATEAQADQHAFYDARYGAGYMQDFSDFFEACRVRTLNRTLRQLSISPRRVLDYGCGEGRYLDLLHEHFPRATVVGSDISGTGLRIARQKRPWIETVPMKDERVDRPTGEFDLILSVEVLEHVADVELATSEIGRLLAPGGRVVLTTPCANPGSLEWTLNRLSGGMESTDDGYGRFSSDEPGHLRRLTSRDLRVLLGRASVSVDRIYYRAQFFTTVMAQPRAERLPMRVRVPIGMLDWHLFRRLPNAATMVVVGTARERVATTRT